MKFIPNHFPQRDIIPLNFIYDKGVGYGNDVLSIIFKNAITHEKFVHQIKQPEIEIYIIKPEKRSEYSTNRNWAPKTDCNKYKVKYASRWNDAKKILGSTAEVKNSPYIFGADTDIENFYILEFIKEYPYDGEIKLNCGYLDIETDIIRGENIKDYGAPPVNAVTFIDDGNNTVYTLLLTSNNLPDLDKSHSQYTEMEAMRIDFERQVKEFRENIEDFKVKLHDMFDEIYGEMEYNIILFDNEKDLHTTLWHIIHQTDVDFLEAWNAPFDFQSLLERPGKIGMDAKDLIVDKRFLSNIKDYNPQPSFFEDDAFDAHKRKHRASFYIMPTIIDDLVSYSGIRAGRGKIPSLKLNAIAEKELGDKKLDFSETGNIRTIYYKDYELWALYNIKDTLLLSGLGRKTKDMYIIYDKLFTKGTMYHQAFTTTKFVLNVFNKFISEVGDGYVLGTNMNKLKNRKKIDYRAFLEEAIEAYEDDDVEEDEFLFGLEDEEEETDEKDEKDEKYDGAYVMNPEHMQSTGHKIMGRDCKYVHDNVADLDITSEYPSAATSCNMSNETMFGKVFIEDESSIEIPIYDGFEFRGNEEAKYKLDKSNFLLEGISENATLQVGELFLDLPSIDAIINNFEEYSKNGK